MKKFIYLSQLFLAAFFLAPLSNGVANGARQENRFLILVDTAHAMRGYSNAIVQGVAELMASDMRGEFREGDTIGLWTYNDKLHPDFPMEIWSKARKNEIISDMTQYLQSQHYEKQAHLDKVLPVLNQVIKRSERLTVVIFFDGSGTIKGTPFDDEINELQKRYARDLKRAHVPFVTVLAVRDGAVFDYTINYPGVIAIPHTAYPEKIIETTNAPIAVVAPTPQPKPRHGASIIMSHSTNVLQIATPAVPKATKPEVKPAPAPAPQPTAPVIQMPTPKPLAPVVQTPPTPAPVAAPTPTPAPPPAKAAAPVVVAMTPPPQAQLATQPVVAEPKPLLAVNNTASQASPPVKVAPVEPPPPDTPAPAPQATLATAAVTPARQLPLFAIAISLLTFAIVLVVYLLRRSHSGGQTSLISQSIDRPR